MSLRSTATHPREAAAVWGHKKYTARGHAQDGQQCQPKKMPYKMCNHTCIAQKLSRCLILSTLKAAQERESSWCQEIESLIIDFVHLESRNATELHSSSDIRCPSKELTEAINLNETCTQHCDVCTRDSTDTHTHRHTKTCTHELPSSQSEVD